MGVARPGRIAANVGFRPAIVIESVANGAHAHTGIDMTSISTKRTMYDALKYCLVQLEVARMRRGG